MQRHRKGKKNIFLYHITHSRKWLMDSISTRSQHCYNSPPDSCVWISSHHGFACPFKHLLFRILSSSVISFSQEMQITSTHDGLISSSVWMIDLHAHIQNHPETKNSGLGATVFASCILLHLHDPVIVITYTAAIRAKHRRFSLR